MQLVWDVRWAERVQCSQIPAWFGRHAQRLDRGGLVQQPDREPGVTWAAVAFGPGKDLGHLGLGRRGQCQARLISQGTKDHGQLPGGEAWEVDDGTEAGGE
jgi:hypothetical protein